MRKLIYICLAFFSIVSSVHGNGRPGDSVRVFLPAHFTANAGQWDASVRYALLGGEGTIWFCDDEIVIVRAKTSKEFPSSDSECKPGEQRFEVTRIGFPPSPRKRKLEALDTLRGVDHFYRGIDSAKWRSDVSTHNRICYRGISDAVDLEIDLNPSANAIVSDIVPEAMMQPAIKYLRDGSAVDEKLRFRVTSNGVQRTSYIDCSELHSYLAVAGYERSTNYVQVCADDRYGYVKGGTTSAAFPTFNAYKSNLDGPGDVVYIKYDIRNRSVVYSTYLGTGGVTIGVGHGSSLFAISDGELFGFDGVDIRYPVTTTLPGTSIQTSEPDKALLIFSLDAAGRLAAASFIGGPGTLYPHDIRIHANRIYLFATVGHDTLKQITADAIEPSAVIHPINPSGLECGYLAVISKGIDSLLYGTYIDPSTTYGSWQYEGALMKVTKDGSVYIVRQKYVSERTKGVLVNAVMDKDDIRVSGAYVIALQPDLKNYRFATWFGFPDRLFEFQTFHSHTNGDLYITGWSVNLPGEPISPPLPYVERYPVNQGCPGAIVVARFGADGQLKGASEICSSSGYNIRCTGFNESMCGNILWAGIAYQSQATNDSVQFALIQPFDSITRAVPPDFHFSDNILIEYDPSTLAPFYSSFWNHKHASRDQSYTRVLPRPNGWVYYSSLANAYSLPLHPDWYILGLPENGFYAADVRIPTPCWTILCDLRMIDTIHVERRRGYFDPVEFDVTYEVSNASAAKEARILRSWIMIPDGLALVAGADTQAMAPALIGPGQSSSVSWRLRVTDPSLLGDTARVRCRVMYVDPESGYDYPAPEELCEKEILVVPYDEPDPLLECAIAGPDSLFWQSPGLATGPAGSPGPVRYTVTITNRDIDPVPIASFHLRAGEHCRILGDTVRPGLTLAPGASHVLLVDVAVDALRFAREIALTVEAWDRYDLVIHSCRTETFVPGAADLYCSTNGTTRIEWYPAAGIAIPSAVTVALRLENPLDTLRADVLVRADLASAPHLALLPGDSLVRGPFDVTARGVKSPSWRFALATPPSAVARDTIVFTYEYEGLVGQCIHVITIDVIDRSLLCALTAVDSVGEAEILARAPVLLHYLLRNLGTVAVTVDKYELLLSPDAGLESVEPLLRAGGAIAPGADVPLEWTLRPRILRSPRIAACTVTAYAGDSVLSVCTEDIFLPGIDGLQCAITSPDTVHFKRDSLTYEPSPCAVTMDLRNLLDTPETGIEAEIDLTGAPRLTLADGESALKTLAALDSHALHGFTWLLEPLKGASVVLQDIRIRYRSSEQGILKECTAAIVIDAWPEIAEVRCATGGHDSLFADPAYELIIPEPFEVSYTVTNTGTIPLTDCRAAIVLPAGFLLAGSDSVQHYGDLAPNETASRWWTLTAMPGLTAFGPYAIEWLWTSNEQGSATGCAHTVHLVPEPSTGIVVTPLRLYFEGELGDPPPPAQTVTLWTGGGLAMPWTAQSTAWYIDVAPAAGDHSAQLAVRPNTTALGKGMHTSALDIAGAAPNLPRRIDIAYLITSLTSTGAPPTPEGIALGPVYPHPVPLDGEARIVVSAEGPVRVTLHDLLGRERAVLFHGMLEGSAPLILRPARIGLVPGSYLLRLFAGGAMRARMVTVVR